MSFTTASPTVTVTATVTVAATPIYFETCWAILSTVGIFNVTLGFLVIGIVGFSYLAIIPIIASIGTAVGNGLCFITFYTDSPAHIKVVTSGIEDIGWLVSDIMVPFYSCFIVRIITRGTERLIHHAIFAFLMSSVIGTRLGVLYERQMVLRAGDDTNHLDPGIQRTVNMLHVGSFIGLALSEIWNGFFLMKKFLKAEKRRNRLRIGADPTDGTSGIIGGMLGFNLYSILARSTEVRLTLMAFVGIMRAITFPFLTTASSATNLPSQVDRFAASIGYLLPGFLYVDLVASKLALQLDRNQSSYYSSNTEKSRQGWASPQPIAAASDMNVEEGRRTTWAGDIVSTGVYNDAKNVSFKTSAAKTVASDMNITTEPAI